jgi:hypothetical protein
LLVERNSSERWATFLEPLKAYNEDSNTSERDGIATNVKGLIVLGCFFVCQTYVDEPPCCLRPKFQPYALHTLDSRVTADRSVNIHKRQNDCFGQLFNMHNNN